MFEDREDAGDRLATLLVDQNVEVDLVLAIPRGGLPIGRAVADALGIPLDVIVAKKIGAPGNPEFAVGAVSSDGNRWVNEDALARLGIDRTYVDEQADVVGETAREKAKRYRGERPPLDLKRKRVLVVDDGVATGGTATACLRTVREAGAAWVGLAVPVGSVSSVTDLAAEANEVLSVETPVNFFAVGQFYEDFGQVSDDEAVRYLDSS